MSLQQLAQRTAHATMIDPGILLSPAQMRQRVDLAPEENRFVRQLEYGTRTTFLRMFSDADREPGEAEITAALKRLVVTPPKKAFLTGRIIRPGIPNAPAGPFRRGNARRRRVDL